MTTKPEQPSLSIEERVQQAARQIAMWAFDELPINPAQEILLAEGCKAILRRYFGDLGGDYSCAVCGFGMKEPCEHWKKMLAASAESQSPAVNSIHEIRPFELPSCHICGAQMTPKTYKCESCKATTGVAPAESQPPRTATSSNQRLGYLEPDAPSDPLCRVEGCGKPRSDKIHYPFPFYSEHNFDNTTERRIGVKEKRKHEEELNPAGNRFRMKWWNWWDDARINIRTGPLDRRQMPSQDSAIGDETPAQLGKKEGIKPMPLTLDPEDKARVQEQINHASQMSGIVAEPAPQVTAERVKSYRHQLLRRDDATETAALSSWSDAEVAAFASSLLAERAAQRKKESHAKFGFVPSPEDPDKCACAYCRRDIEALFEHSGDLEMTNADLEATVAERDRTIAELKRRKGDHCCDAQFDLEAMRQHFTALGLTETNTKKDGLIEQIWRNTRAGQAEQERDAREKDLCRTVNILQSISHPSGVSRFEDAMHAIRELQDCYLTAKGKTNRLEATAERLRGLLREWYLHYLNNGEWDELPLALRQRIQKELEP